ncbi:M13 family metallopeptidase [Flammeovirga yaeyamensis]|uniref:M13 family metallopeptidase n=1 Tax=Flammeovirga yaeyamensis TaxID=367791 RepID=A0AAX1N6Y2_9BACT|nr:M13 family metallopeptidase [Flammeovirga yaeyamensis]MBB3697825.1 putative endopeptidase [Flammeovirga yaeyamensis]NMF35819.1 M13 family metallopeptidase [Flammeovirga yaeyamensis]QWG03229.1 M13 family metallopeptidase [Flammeovirga yaeyamensis]
MKWLLLFSINILFLVGCDREETQNNDQYLFISDLDSTVAPQDNFYLYANGGWQQREDIPKNLSSWGSHKALREKNNQILEKLLTQKNNYPKNSNQAKAIKFYQVGMDSAEINHQSYAPLVNYLNDIKHIDTYFDLQDMIVRFHRMQIHPFFRPTIFQDKENKEQQAVYLEFEGMSFQNPNFYFMLDSISSHNRDNYITHITNMFHLLGYADEESQTKAKNAFTIEQGIAKAYKSSLAKQPNLDYYNPKTLENLNGICQTFIWPQYFKSLGIKTDRVILTNPEYFANIDAIILKNGLEKVKDYLLWRLLHFSAPHLSSEFVNEDFSYFGKIRDGLLDQPHRWEKVLFETNKSVGMAVGQIYIEHQFSDIEKKQAEELIQNILSTAQKRIDKVSWLSPSALKTAKRKLEGLVVKVGYPDAFPSYESLTLTDTYLHNIFSVNEWEFKQKVASLNVAADKDKWIIPPQSVNAYYNSLNNEFVIAAGILQPPFYFPEADDAINYGAIGAIIAHEITHGFDDIGRRYNEYGEEKNWWTLKDYNTFKQRTNLLIQQYNQYEPLSGYFVNGNLTLNENIADLSGLALAYNSFKEHNRSHEKINGYTPEQRFFFSWAKVWRSKTRIAVLRDKLVTERHAPGEYRVNGPLSNFTPFYEAFDVKKGQGMWRDKENRVTIW